MDETSHKIEHLKLIVDLNNIQNIRFSGNQDVLGFNKKDLKWPFLRERIHPEDKRSLLESIKTESEKIDFQIRLRHHDGQYRWIKCYGQKMESEMVLNCYSMDITHIPDNNIALLKSISHDLRSPINSILGAAQILQMELEDNAEIEEKKKILSIINESCLSAIGLVEDIMELSVLGSGEAKFETEKTQLRNFIQNFINTHRILAIKKNIKVQFIFDEIIDPVADINRDKFNRILDNILNNAIKFSEPGSEIRFYLLDKDPYFDIVIQDFGIGMSDEILNNLFNPFGAARRLGLKGEKSHGLGMSIIKHLVELHKGSLRIYSEEGIGTKVSIRIKKPNNHGEDSDNGRLELSENDSEGNPERRRLHV